MSEATTSPAFKVVDLTDRSGPAVLGGAPPDPPRDRLTDPRLVTGAITVLADVLTAAAAYAIAGQHGLGAWSTLPIWPAALALAGLYRPAAESQDRFRRLAVAVGFAALSVGAVERFQGQLSDRSALVLLGASALAGLWMQRRVTARALMALTPRLGAEQRVVIVGTNHEARILARSLSRGARPGARPVGFLGTAAGPSVEGMPVLGDLDDMEAVLAAARADAAVIASTALEGGCLAEVTARLQAAGVETSISVGLPALAATRVSITSLDGVAMLQVRPHRLSGGQRILKRTVDLVGAVLGLAACLPVLAVLALAVRVTSGPGIIYSQLRVGAGGRPFRIFKLRTMVPGADRLVGQLAGRNQADGILFKVFDDPRITPVGRFLRRYGLDELPQLWNVLRGEMSLVGPRPPLPDETERYDEWVRGRLGVKPGITGLWQINGRHRLSWDDYVHYDLFYVENWSLSMDLKVILRTVPALVAHRGAY